MNEIFSLTLPMKNVFESTAPLIPSGEKIYSVMNSLLPTKILDRLGIAYQKIAGVCFSTVGIEALLADGVNPRVHSVNISARDKRLLIGMGVGAVIGMIGGAIYSISQRLEELDPPGDENLSSKIVVMLGGMTGAMIGFGVMGVVNCFIND